MFYNFASKPSHLCASYNKRINTSGFVFSITIRPISAFSRTVRPSYNISFHLWYSTLNVRSYKIRKLTVRTAQNLRIPPPRAPYKQIKRNSSARDAPTKIAGLSFVLFNSVFPQLSGDFFCRRRRRRRRLSPHNCTYSLARAAGRGWRVYFWNIRSSLRRINRREGGMH